MLLQEVVQSSLASRVCQSCLWARDEGWEEKRFLKYKRVELCLKETPARFFFSIFLSMVLSYGLPSYSLPSLLPSHCLQHKRHQTLVHHDYDDDDDDEKKRKEKKRKDKVKRKAVKDTDEGRQEQLQRGVHDAHLLVFLYTFSSSCFLCIFFNHEFCFLFLCF